MDINRIPKWIIEGVKAFKKKAYTAGDLQKISQLYDQYVKGNVDEDLLLEVKMIVLEYIDLIDKELLLGEVSASEMAGLERIKNNLVGEKDVNKSMQYIDLFLHVMHDSGDLLEAFEMGQAEPEYIKNLKNVKPDEDPKYWERHEKIFNYLEETQPERSAAIDKIIQLRNLAMNLFLKGTEDWPIKQRIEQLLRSIDDGTDKEGEWSIENLKHYSIIERVKAIQTEINQIASNLNLSLEDFLNKFVADPKDQEHIRMILEV